MIKKKKYSIPDFAKLAKMGGDATKKKYGRAHFVAMVEKRWKNQRKREREAAKLAKNK
jgi:hypothetical protein